MGILLNARTIEHTTRYDHMVKSSDNPEKINFINAGISVPKGEVYVITRSPILNTNPFPKARFLDARKVMYQSSHRWSVAKAKAIQTEKIYSAPNPILYFMWELASIKC